MRISVSLPFSHVHTHTVLPHEKPELLSEDPSWEKTEGDFFSLLSAPYSEMQDLDCSENMDAVTPLDEFCFVTLPGTSSFSPFSAKCVLESCSGTTARRAVAGPWCWHLASERFRPACCRQQHALGATALRARHRHGTRGRRRCQFSGAEELQVETC